jgi:hypothetical protein
VGALRASQLCEQLEAREETDEFSGTSRLVDALVRETLLAQSELDEMIEKR